VEGYNINGVKVLSSHYADDTFLYCKATIRKIQRVRQALEIMADETRLKINWEKSYIHSIKVCQRFRTRLANLLGAKVGEEKDVYLGIPIYNWHRIKS